MSKQMKSEIEKVVFEIEKENGHCLVSAKASIRHPDGVGVTLLQNRYVLKTPNVKDCVFQLPKMMNGLKKTKI